MRQRAVFLDKDGTLIRDIPYNTDPEKIILNDYASEGLTLLSARNYLYFIITNQPGIALGYFKEEALDGVKNKISGMFKKSSADLTGFLYCPHKENSHCLCRKPSPGLILQAAREFKLNLTESWMIGDILNDIEAGNRAGCHTVLIDNGNETEWKDGVFRTPEFIASSLQEAAEYILNKS
ncbi:MAG TPA: HAD family hydrolase [Bacteroidales bacterium]|nr:HAD family hydrolase [Bacteroidales bacterium]